MEFLKIFLISLIFLYSKNIYANNKFTNLNSNSIIKIFCLESVKSEFKRNDIEYRATIGEDVCNCYLSNISKKITHKEAISQCRKDNKKKFNL
tara:strand:- start:330 stop:608 length:279 start_codon:yes stop_codon:yes gene_type:complete